MRSTTAFTWARPIAFTAEFARTIDAEIRAFAERAVQTRVIEEGHSPLELKNADQARKRYEESHDYRFESIARNIERINSVSWRVRLQGDISLHPISTTELINLPNVKGRYILSAAIANESPLDYIEIAFTNLGVSAGATASIRSNFEIVEVTAASIRQRFAVATRPWWLMRSGKFLWAVWWIFALGINTYPLIAFLTGSKPDANFSFGEFWTLGLPTLSAVVILGFMILAMMNRWWDWMFPMVDFCFGGGDERSRSKKNMRAALWTVPIILIGFPLMANWFSGRLTK